MNDAPARVFYGAGGYAVAERVLCGRFGGW